MKRWLRSMSLFSLLAGCTLAQSSPPSATISEIIPTATIVRVEMQASSQPAPVQPTQTPVPTAIPTEDRNMSNLPNRGAAPEFLNTVWLNTDQPLRLANLRGSVVLLEFWTFDCINCIHTLPYVQQWHETYQDQGLVVIGDHYPEFRYEHDLQNVKAAIERLGVTYPIAQDNDAGTWRSYGQRYWPTMYLIDKWGNIRYIHIGEGRYDETENAIIALLNEQYTPDENDESIVQDYLVPTVVLNVRSGAGTNYDQIGTIHPGMSFVILSGQDDWYEISYNDGVGFVSGEYVTVGSTD